MSISTTDAAVSDCQARASEHYENFPVASIVLPRRLRSPIAAIYAFARSADDIADEGDVPAWQRLQHLDQYEAQIRAVERGDPADSTVFIALAAAMRDYALPTAPLYDLLDAFKQDIRKQRYANTGEVLDYCRRSANPIGRLLLTIFGHTGPMEIRYSDSICSALQLINFLQDIDIDYSRGRIYFAKDELEAFGVSEDYIAQRRYNAKWRTFMCYQLDRAERMLIFGRPLGRILAGRVGLELRLTVAGGLRVIAKLRHQNRHTFTRQARLNAYDWVRMMVNAI